MELETHESEDRCPDYPLYKDHYNLDIKRIYKLSENLNNRFIFQKPREIKSRIYKTNLNIFKPEILNVSYGFLLLEDNPEDNEELNYLTDYFTLPERINANFINNPTPCQYYRKNKETIYKDLKWKSEKDIKTISDYFKFDKYMFDHVKFANNFRISIILKVLEIFKPRKWLDISAGWGDRLLSAILSPYVHYYHSTDPNLELHKHYKEILKRFNVSEKHYNIKKIGFENLKIKDEYYDLIFSSPPFFKTEVYSNNPDDSLVKFSTDRDWYINFFIVSVLKALRGLKIGHYFVLNIKFYGKEGEYLTNKRLMTDLNNIPNLQNCGSFYYYHVHNFKPRELMVFKKIGKI